MKAYKLLVLSLLLFPVLANAGEVPAGPSAPAAFLESLSAAPGSCEAKLPGAAGVPEPILATGCQASVDCFARCTLTCEGTSSCQVGSGSITCDGWTQVCAPACSAPLHCVDVCGKCECQAEGYSATFCANVYC